MVTERTGRSVSPAAAAAIRGRVNMVWVSTVIAGIWSTSLEFDYDANYNRTAVRLFPRAQPSTASAAARA
ncbi:hypothetical protein MTOK_11520 [Mycolicibacterium tokaiense]|nr:hypothetical protein MTOK_11520 [Mycolicibacterium tokaiense]